MTHGEACFGWNIPEDGLLQEAIEHELASFWRMNWLANVKKGPARTLRF
jgi:hypothetical protein